MTQRPLKQGFVKKKSGFWGQFKLRFLVLRLEGNHDATLAVYAARNSTVPPKYTLPLSQSSLHVPSGPKDHPLSFHILWQNKKVR
jgi:hypothetical protein